MKFIDEARICIEAGCGGNGCMSFRREKYAPNGGPSGGNGGGGGSIYFAATSEKTTLIDFKFKPKYQAERGEHGKGSDKYGKGGKDCLLSVPLGTRIYDFHTGEFLHDLIEEGKPVCLAHGGKGGRGNLSFLSSTNRAPRTTTKGEPGAALELKLELRLIADVGLVGLPNAGKSSLLRRISKATPKVADYPFTTLEPCLGVAHHKGECFVAADLPGLTQGASHGVGLGDKFLRHASRNRIILHLVDASHELDAISNNVEIVRRELSAYDPELLQREEILVFTKIDLIGTDWKSKQTKLTRCGLRGVGISSHSGEGISRLLDRVLKGLPPHRLPAVADPDRMPAGAFV